MGKELAADPVRSQSSVSPTLKGNLQPPGGERYISKVRFLNYRCNNNPSVIRGLSQSSLCSIRESISSNPGGEVCGK